jgi:hypothetical protein
LRELGRVFRRFALQKRKASEVPPTSEVSM